MSDHPSVAAMAESYAQKAVEQARDLHAQLDFTENSLLDLETILDRVAQNLPLPGSPAPAGATSSTGAPSSGSATSAGSASASASSDVLTEICKTWGCYLGEVVRRRFGGEWSIETYPGKQFATLTLTVQGSKIFPSMKIHRRLTQTSADADNVWAFFKMVKQRLEAAPRVH
ncbi:MAG: hypothetical protein LAO20_18235 [Acidobacteriia bacterium]|nr:hypothetical protein [Terriglobia bacterium]